MSRFAFPALWQGIFCSVGPPRPWEHRTSAKPEWARMYWPLSGSWATSPDHRINEGLPSVMPSLMAASWSTQKFSQESTFI